MDMEILSNLRSYTGFISTVMHLTTMHILRNAWLGNFTIV